MGDTGLVAMFMPTASFQLLSRRLMLPFCFIILLFNIPRIIIIGNHQENSDAFYSVRSHQPSILRVNVTDD